MELPKAQGTYETGQLFLHRVFGYRGVILFPWLARVYDRDLPAQSKNGQQAEAITAAPAPPSGETPPNAGKEVQKKTHTFYQVLIDQRDCPYIRAQTEAVTFLGNQESSRSLYAIPGLDYVAHEDILPYSSGEQHPLQHELFDKFLAHQPDKDPPFVAQDTLRAWQKKNHPWLELSDVHKETTEGIRVTVIPFYMGCRETPAASVYWVSLLSSSLNFNSRLNFLFQVALLHPAGEPRRTERPVARTTLANLLPLGHAGNGPWPGCRRPGTRAQPPPAGLPVQLAREPAGAEWPHVGHVPHGARGRPHVRLSHPALFAREQTGR